MAVVSMTVTKLKPDISVDDAREIYDNSVIPVVKGEKGFIGGWLMISEDNDEGIAVALWESKEDAVAFEKGGLYQEQVKKFLPFIKSMEGRKYYNVNSEIVFLKALEAI